VSSHQRSYVGVDRRCCGSFVLLLLSEDLARERDRNSGELAAEQLAHAFFVRRVAMRVDEADGYRLDRCFAKASRDCEYVGVIEGDEDGACRVNPLRDFKAKVTWHERRRVLPEVVVQMR